MRLLLISCLIISSAAAQCPPGGCPAPRLGGFNVPTIAPAPPQLEWWTVKGKPGLVALYVNGEKVGTLDPVKGEWKDMEGRVTGLRKYLEDAAKSPTTRQTEATPTPEGGRSATPPAPKAGICDCDNCPDGCKCGCPGGLGKPRDNGPRPKFGVEREKLDDREKFALSGREIDRAEALNALEGLTDIPDDAGKVRLTVIGSAAARKTVLEDLKSAPALAYWRDQFVVQGYSPDYWRVKDGGFKTPATLTDAVVYVQKPDGTVLWRQDTYRGPEELAGNLRDKVPGYDPLKDPQPGPGPSPLPGPPTPGPDVSGVSWWWALPVGVVIFFLVYFRRIA